MFKTKKDTLFLPIHFSMQKFETLSRKELYDILQLRSAVFVVEQTCIYQDIDGKDDKALHILGKSADKLVAYARCFPPTIYFKEAAIGRVIIHKEYRNKGLGHQLIKAAIAAIKTEYKTTKIRISAQQHLTKFYESHQFKVVGDGYLEDGIPHIQMIRE